MSTSLRADLHVHTVLSPCADVEMIPPLIVARARSAGLGLIAVTDHNACANCAAVVQAAAGSGLAVLAGMELQTREEVHVLCLFDTVDQALAWEAVVQQHLPDTENPEDVLGAQYMVDAMGGHVRTETRLLLASADLALADAVQRVAELGGIAIPAHIDRPAFGLLGQLGFVPSNLAALGVPALEISRHLAPDTARARHPDLGGWTLIHGSDAHCLADLGAGITLRALRVPGVAAIAAALRALRAQRDQI